MKNRIFIAVSLDGYIARKDGSIDWLMHIPNPENNDYGYNEFINDIDAIVMGKNTYEKVLSFDEWPYEKPVFILSNKLKEIPESLKGKVELIQGTPNHIVEHLNNGGYTNLYIDGGKTIQKFLELELIDEIIISHIPIILGSGIPLFDESSIEQKFEHVKTDTYNNGIVKSHYRKVIK
jgi:dihydrofolate reductase